MNVSIKRTHDELYLGENRYDDTKEIFKFCLSLVKNRIPAKAAVADIGCAAGEFAYYLRKQLPDSVITGIDFKENLIEKARDCVSGVDFRVGSVENKALLPEKSQDVTFLVGVHSIFDDPLPAFDNLVRWTRPGGRVLIFGLFNPYPLDVWVKTRTMDDPPEHREPGWNMISQETVRRHMEKHPRVKTHLFHEFEMPKDNPAKADPLRSWTYMHDNKRQIINGTGLKHEFFALVLDII